MPGWARSAASAAASWATLGTGGGPSPWPGPNCSTYTGTAADCDWLAAARPSEACSPNAKITAVAPNAMAASVTAVRACRAKGAASPRPSWPRQAQPGREPVRGVPVARPRGAAGRDRLRGGQPPGAQRLPNPASSTRTAIPAGAATDAHHGTCWRPTPYTSAELFEHRDREHVARHHPADAAGRA